MSDEPKACANCGGDHVVEEWRRQDDRWRRWRVTCDKCGMRTDWHGTREAAIATWNTRADDTPELLQDDACAILRRVAADKTAVSSDDLLRYAVGADMVPEALSKIADMIERDYVHRDSIADDAPEHTVDNQADSWERLEADVYDSFSDVALSEQMRDVLRSRVHTWLDRQAAITRAEVFDDGEYDCRTCGAKRELQERVDSLTAERDRLRRFVDGGAYDCMTCEAKAELAERADSLEAELARKQHVCDVQRESFLKLERENRELQDVCGELERTIENMRGME